MKKGRLYTVVFMLIVSAVFALLLAGANAYYLPKIKANELLDEQIAILYVFDIEQSGSADEVLERFNENVEPATVSGIELYQYTSSDGKPIAYAVPFTGAGLWGSISGYIGVTPELDTITGLVFTDHSETPGLGGRIDELVYREQFKDLAIAADTNLSYGEEGGDQIDAITGATSTSNAVLRILNELLDETISKLRGGQ